MDKIKKLIWSVVEEKDNFNFDQPQRIGEKSKLVVLPIQLQNGDKKEVEYLTLNEARDVEIKDTSRINEVYVKNNERLPLYIVRGQILEGKTQERVIIHNFMVARGKGANIPVKCVHVSRGIAGGAGMYYTGSMAPRTVDVDGTQHDVWNSVSTYTSTYSNITSGSSGNTGNVELTANLEASSGTTEGWQINETTLGVPTETYDDICCYHGLDTWCDSYVPQRGENKLAKDDLVATVKDVQVKVKDIIKNTPLSKNQVGAAVLLGNHVIGFEYYSHPNNWKAIRDDIIMKEGIDAVKEEDDDIFVYREDKVKELVKKSLKKSLNSITIKNIYSGEYILDYVELGDLRGEVTYYEGELIHCSLWSKE